MNIETKNTYQLLEKAKAELAVIREAYDKKMIEVSVLLASYNEKIEAEAKS